MNAIAHVNAHPFRMAITMTALAFIVFALLMGGCVPLQQPCPPESIQLPEGALCADAAYTVTHHPGVDQCPEGLLTVCTSSCP